MLKKLSLMVSALLFLLSGCTVGPSYRGPPNSDLHAFHNVPASPPDRAASGSGASDRAASDPSASLDSWWTAFHDPVLSQIIDRALNQNLDLAASIARVDQARAAARGAGARLLPAASFDGGVDQLHQSLNGPIGAIAHDLPGYERDQTLYATDVGANWELDLAGGLKRGAEAARAEAQVAESEQLGVRISVVAEAADAYLQIRGNQARLAIARSQVDTDARLLALIRLRLSQGASSDKEVAQAEALLSQARATIAPLRIALEEQSNRLDVLLGAQPGTYTALLAKPADIPAAPIIPAEQDAAQLLRRRPDIIAAERRLAASNALIGVALSEYYPKVSLAAALGFESLSASHLIGAASFQPQAAAGLRWRLFDFGRVDAEVAQADSAHAQALLAYRQAVLRATADVENAFMSLGQVNGQIRDLSDEVDALSRARDTSQELYLAGASSLTDVLDADRQSLIAQDELARARTDLARSAVASFRALGGGWSM